MKRILLFGGTAESHPLIEWLLSFEAKIMLCVTSAYAQSLIAPNPQLNVQVGRLDTQQMGKLMSSQRFDCVIDATHPYAQEVTRNIKEAAKKSGLRYFRLLRPASLASGCIAVASVAQAVEHLNQTNGRVLIATGSKELGAYAQMRDFSERCYPRVLPTVEAIEQCTALGFLQSHIIAMQGPFSKEFNKALFEQLKIETLVTKDGGLAGGFPEKLDAAKECKIETILVQRPEDAGDSLGELTTKLAEFLNFDIK